MSQENCRGNDHEPIGERGDGVVEPTGEGRVLDVDHATDADVGRDHHHDEADASRDHRREREGIRGRHHEHHALLVGELPPASLPQSGLAGNLSVLVEAVPNADFATSSSPDGKHRATVRISAHTYPVATLGAARALVRAFIEDNDLGGGNLPPTAGRVRLDGKPFAHISYNGRIWRVDGKWKESGQELDESGKPLQEQTPKAGALVKFMSPGPHGSMKLAGTVKRVLPDSRLEIRSQNHGIHTLHPSELGHQADDCHCKKTAPKAKRDEVAAVSAPITSESADAKPTRTRTKKAPAEKPAEKKPAKKKSAEKDAPKPALSDSEAEELANLFAAASAEDKPK